MHAADTIRPGEPGDLEAILRILNHYILETHHTFDTRPFAAEDQADWIARFSTDGPQQLLLAEADGRVVGYAHSTPFRPKPAYDTTVETTVYIDPQHTGRGLGRRLLGDLLERLAGTEAHRAIGVIALPNDASLALHRRLGFEKIGVFSEAGFKLGRFWDVAWYQRSLSRMTGPDR
jgi:phosphinothricin acetyltransferase